MTNKDRFMRWITDTIRTMDEDEFCRFTLAFCAGYKDGPNDISCEDICGHPPGLDCENCAEHVREFMRKECGNGHA